MKRVFLPSFFCLKCFRSSVFLLFLGCWLGALMPCLINSLFSHFSSFLHCHVLINNQLELLRPSLKTLLFAIYYHPPSFNPHCYCLMFLLALFIILYSLLCITWFSIVNNSCESYRKGESKWKKVLVLSLSYELSFRWKHQRFSGKNLRWHWIHIFIDIFMREILKYGWSFN